MDAALKNPLVDKYLHEAEKWQKESEALREIFLSCQLQEEIKWSKPCYTFQSHNVAILLLMNDSCAILFLKGALLEDPTKALVKPGEGSNAGRQMRFTSTEEINRQIPLIKEFIAGAIAVEKSGLKVVPAKIVPPPPPLELQNKFDETPLFQQAFNALTPGRQRAYIRYFSEPKQSATRIARIEKCQPAIMDGKGLRD